MTPEFLKKMWKIHVSANTIIRPYSVRDMNVSCYLAKFHDDHIQSFWDIMSLSKGFV